jgi:hypothetical protein
MGMNWRTRPRPSCEIQPKHEVVAEGIPLRTPFPGDSRTKTPLVETFGGSDSLIRGIIELERNHESMR